MNKMTLPAGLAPESPLVLSALVGAIFFASSSTAFAVEFENGDLKGSWDNTMKYSLGSRLSNPSDTNLKNANADDPEQNFDKGSLIMNRFDWLSELNARYQNYGLSLSAAVWYDDVYNRHNDNNSPGTFNPYSVSNDEFTDDTRKWAGGKVELMNAFVSGQFTPFDVPVSVRLGQHTLLWGESLFFTDNGIASAMAPVDAYKASSVPNTKAQELFLPTKQISASAMFEGGWTVEGFYQFEWEKTRIPPVGAFMSSADILDEGGERIIAGPGAFFYRGKDHDPDGEQFGVSLRWRPQTVNLDLGIYAVQYDEKTPQLVVSPSGGFDPTNGSIGTYSLRYQERVKLYGISANTTVGQLNIGGEISYRENGSLRANTDVLDPHVLGDTVHAQINAIYVGNAGALWDGYSLAGELAGHHLTKITKNKSEYDESLNDTAYGARGTATLSYYQLTPGLDLDVPIGLGYNFKGQSPVSPAFNSYGSDRGGDISVGVVAIYQQDWKLGLNVTHFFGSEDNNYYSGRDFAIASLTHTF
ncbi:DUF1302 domain-containing protein [Pseudomonas sp. FP2300]|uniref:DUF1302 domain-containing protein n=1 Tax=Pseudomonas sp. FP2300 TaxID=2954090 RepID=UPI002736EBFF|nr:DUF1302 family protein [Pseudomonas sp. FP2300]WLH65196.1 DUF1302 family protein [Pseudomonas sp. FP2300]